MKILSLFILIFAAKTARSASGVFWKPWKGPIPEDAVVAGYTKTEYGDTVPIYLTQWSPRTDYVPLQPAQMFKESNYIEMVYDNEPRKVENTIKILCADDPEQVTWLPIKKAPNFENDCLNAGSKHLEKSFFGRYRSGNKTFVGNVDVKTKTMRYFDMNKEKTIDDFEILCNKKIDDDEPVSIEIKLGDVNTHRVEISIAAPSPQEKTLNEFFRDARNPELTAWVPARDTDRLNLKRDCMVYNYDEKDDRRVFFARGYINRVRVLGFAKIDMYPKVMEYQYYGQDQFLDNDFDVLCYREGAEKLGIYQPELTTQEPPKVETLW